MRLKFRKLGPRAESGSAAVEFALIAPVLLSLLFAITEVGLGFFADMVLANGVATVGRLIRTGQVQSQNMSAATFRSALCDQVKAMLSCDPAKLLIDVRSFTSFGTANFPQAIDASGNLNGGLNAYQPGSSGQSAGSAIVLVRAFYLWTYSTPLIGQYLSNMHNNTRLLAASMAFRNEPF